MTISREHIAKRSHTCNTKDKRCKPPVSHTKGRQHQSALTFSFLLDGIIRRPTYSTLMAPGGGEGGPQISCKKKRSSPSLEMFGMTTCHIEFVSQMPWSYP